MNYLIVARGFNEPDNNTPSDEVFVKIIDCGQDEIERYVKRFEDDMYEDYPVGVNIETVPVERIKDDWEKVVEIW